MYIFVRRQEQYPYEVSLLVCTIIPQVFNVNCWWIKGKELNFIVSRLISSRRLLVSVTISHVRLLHVPRPTLTLHVQLPLYTYFKRISHANTPCRQLTSPSQRALLYYFCVCILNIEYCEMCIAAPRRGRGRARRPSWRLGLAPRRSGS